MTSQIKMLKNDIVIVLHIYHVELWEYFNEKLKKINCGFDLYVTLCQDNQDISNKILSEFPSANIKQYPNKGQDIEPFLKTINEIRGKDYKYLIKLHSKKCEYNLKLGSHWRGLLVNSLIGSKEILYRNISIIKESDYKMCGSKHWIRSQYSPLTKNIPMNFIGGTMFITDFKIFVENLTEDMANKWCDKMPFGYVRDVSYTHKVERMLGHLIVKSGYKIKGV